MEQLSDAAMDPVDADVTADAITTDRCVTHSMPVRFTVTLPEDTTESDDVFIAGTFCQMNARVLPGDCCNWIPVTLWNETTSDRDNNTVDLELNLLSNVTYKYKYTLVLGARIEVQTSCGELDSARNCADLYGHLHLRSSRRHRCLER